MKKAMMLAFVKGTKGKVLATIQGRLQGNATVKVIPAP
jgi:hypothetical protein